MYTHSEMLPAHYYPAFKKYPNFVGNYGNAWWKRKKKNLNPFNGPILMTTNCIVPPKDSYKTGFTLPALRDIRDVHIFREKLANEKNFSAIIEHAKNVSLRVKSKPVKSSADLPMRRFWLWQIKL